MDGREKTEREMMVMDLEDKIIILLFIFVLMTVAIINFLAWKNILSFNYNWILEPLFLSAFVYVLKKRYSDFWLCRYWPMMASLFALADIVLNCVVLNPFSLEVAIKIFLMVVPSLIVWLLMPE